MTYNSDIIARSCYLSMKEGINGVESQFSLLTTKQIINNIVFNFGKIFDAVRDSILFFTGDSRGQYNIPYDAGFGFGSALALIMKKS